MNTFTFDTYEEVETSYTNTLEYLSDDLYTFLGVDVITVRFAHKADGIGWEKEFTNSEHAANYIREIHEILGNHYTYEIVL